MNCNIIGSTDYSTRMQYIVRDDNNQEAIKKFVGKKNYIGKKATSNDKDYYLVKVITSIATPTDLEPEKVKNITVRVIVGEYIMKDLKDRITVISKGTFDSTYTID